MIAVDDTGVGGGVVDILRSNGWGVLPVNFGEKPVRDEDSCFNRRTELWVALRDWIVKEAALAGLDAAVRQELESDLTTVKYKFKPDGRRMLEPKADQKTRIGRSPDYGAWLEADRDGVCTTEKPCQHPDCPHCHRERQDEMDRMFDRYTVKKPRGPGFYD